ncbi:hypothetical protein BCD67_16055 [Oscillatoriales cyanobacterium USR001]|nr:hypothetical protein BCD67_16055 [Oscillatoriales cyanobacterium USR001]
MSQNVMTKQIALESEAIAKSPTSVDSYAERLMDELFEDVDRALESGNGLPTEPVQPAEFVSLKPIVVPQIILPTPENSFQENNINAEAIARKAILIAKQQEAKESFDRLLLGAAFASLLLTFGLWMASRNSLQSTKNTAISASQAAAAAKVEADVKFGAYMQQALEALDQKKAAAKSKNTSLPGVPVTNLPTIAVPASPPTSAGLTQAINRVADALQEASAQSGVPQTQVVIVPPAPGSQAPAPAAVAVKPETKGSTATTTEPTNVGDRTAPEAAPPARILSPQEQPASAPEATTETQPAASTSPSPTTAASEASTVTHTLVGVLELGERSAALFEIEGVARRIYVGESIGASGWTLAEVKNQEAIIRKGGEVRSIFVGQKF